VYRLIRRAASLIHTFEIEILLNLPSIMLVLMFVNDEDIDHDNVSFRTGPGATYLVLAGDLAPAHHVGDPWFKNYSRIFKDSGRYSRTTSCFSRIKDITSFDSKFKDNSWRSRTSGNLSQI